ncbi:MAG: FecR domain-containing protein [Pseudomonadota bacterium]
MPSQIERLRAWAGDDAARREAAERALRIWTASSALTPKAKRGKGGGLGVLLVLATLGALLYPTIKIELEAEFIARRSVLSDVAIAPGVSADLDAGTALDVERGADASTVRILDGAAFFDVTPGSDRVVEVVAEAVTVRVTGTQFAVETGEDRVSVAVLEGAVTIAVDGGGPMQVAAGDVWRGNDASAGEVSAISDVASVAAWREGWLDADDLSLRDVAAILDRRFTGQIFFADGALADQRVTGRYRLDDPMDALSSAAAAHGGRVLFATPWLALVVSE